MELKEYGFEKPELLVVTEKIYATKGKISDLKIELDCEQFHAKYIPVRQKRLSEQAGSNMLVLIPLTLFLLICLSLVIVGIVSHEPIMGLFMLAGVIGLVFGGYFEIKLLRTQIEMMRILKYSGKEEKALQYAKKKDVNTIQSDAITSREHMDMLTTQIEALESELSRLQERQNELLSHKISAQQRMREQGVMFDEKPDTLSDSGFRLKPGGMASLEVSELWEIYDKEERYLQSDLEQLNVNLQTINKRIVSIEEDFENSKKMLMFAGIIFVLMILFQAAFTGFGATVSSLLCLLISVAGVLYLDKKCTSNIVAHLIEIDSVFTQEYVFINNIEPAYRKRQVILRQMDEKQRELEEIKMKKDSLEV